MSSKFTLAISKLSPRKKSKLQQKKICLQTLSAYPRAKAHPGVLNMYFEGFFGF